MNIWSLPKEPPIRVVLLVLDSAHDLTHLRLDLTDRRNRRAVGLYHRDTPGLGAYLFTYGQSQARYGLQLQYPAATAAGVQPYDALEELPLCRVIELLSMHFDLD